MSFFESIPTAGQFNRPLSNPCVLLDFGLLNLIAGESYTGSTGDREVLAVLLGGQAAFTVDGRDLGSVGGRPNVFAGKPHSVYLPAGSAYQIKAHSRLEVALVSAPSDLRTPAYVIPPDRITTGVWGAANFSRNFHQILTLAGQPDLPACRLIVGETYTPSGNWSTFPPHRHEKDDLPREADHEEIYYFKMSPADGFGLTRHYSASFDASYVVRDSTLLMAPDGYHTVASAPGYTTYYLWALAGTQRVQATVDDPALAWVSRTIPMLRSLGH